VVFDTARVTTDTAANLTESVLDQLFAASNQGRGRRSVRRDRSDDPIVRDDSRARLPDAPSVLGDILRGLRIATDAAGRVVDEVLNSYRDRARRDTPPPDRRTSRR
jgi:hypothetical protein